MKIFAHFKTIMKHRSLVRKGCFKIGLYRQGLLHDLSKYSPAEFFVGAKYFQGNRSPNNAEREDIGYSSAWLHHKGRNKHHYEYWIDYSIENQDGSIIPVSMPDKYVAEMMMDRVAASKTYKGKDYNDRCPLEYYNIGKDNILIHPETRKKLETMLNILAEQGEEELYRYIRTQLLGKKR